MHEYQIPRIIFMCTRNEKNELYDYKQKTYTEILCVAIVSKTN